MRLDNYSQALEEDPNAVINVEDTYEDLYKIVRDAEDIITSTLAIGERWGCGVFSDFLGLAGLLWEAQGRAKQDGTWTYQEAFDQMKELGYGMGKEERYTEMQPEEVTVEDYAKFLDPSREFE